jgi:ankyrin repeat protein
LQRWFELVYGGKYEAPRPSAAERAFEELGEWRTEPFVACAVGDETVLRRELERDRDWANRVGGPLAMTPLLAVSFSALVHLPRFASGLRRCARLLLDAGADRDATWTPVEFPDGRFGALYGAAGHTHDPALTRMLLDAGADPNDRESLYHSMDSPDLACTQQLLEAGATVSGTNALFHALDHDNIARLELLLAHGGDPNEVSDGLGRPLHHAIRRGRSLAHIDALLAAGADPAARTSSGVSAALLAFRHGRTDVVQRFGLDEPLSERERFIGACARADRDEAAALLAARPALLDELSEEQLRQLPVLAEAGRRDAVEVMVALGWPIEVRGGDWSASALNFAVFRGDAQLTEFLLDRGALWTSEHDYNDNVMGTLSFASGAQVIAGGDWLGCARALVAHGMPRPPARYAFADDVESYFAGL